MKTKSIFRKTAAIILSAMLFAACSKTGPAGPQGPAGPKGEQGDKGATGAKGAKGTANVIYSDWISFTPKEEASGSYYDASVAAPKITKENFDHAAILVYYLLNTGIAAQLDLYQPYSGWWVHHEIYVGGIYLMGTLEGDPDKIRYIIIPGGVHARMSNPLPDFKDYHAVCKYYGIPE